MEANINVPLIRRAMIHRHSLRCSKRLTRSTSGTSPLARNLLRSLHEQKRAALAEQRARRWELYSVVNQNVLLEPKAPSFTEKDEADEEERVVPSLIPTAAHEAETNSTYDIKSKTKKKGLMRFRTVKKHVSQVVTRLFVRKTSKHQVASSGDDDGDSDLKSFRRYPSTVL